MSFFLEEGIYGLAQKPSSSGRYEEPKSQMIRAFVSIKRIRVKANNMMQQKLVR